MSVPELAPRRAFTSHDEVRSSGWRTSEPPYEVHPETVRLVLGMVKAQMLTRHMGPATLERIARDLGVTDE